MSSLLAGSCAAALVVTSVPSGLGRAGERASASPHPEDAIQDRLDIRSHIDTVRKHGHNTLTVLHGLMTGSPWRLPSGRRTCHRLDDASHAQPSLANGDPGPGWLPAEIAGNLTISMAGLPGRACCYWRGSADAARSRASDPAADRARPAAILGLRCCTARAASRT
jgi:hypothetical protein